jgi:hypothetical protein
MKKSVRIIAIIMAALFVLTGVLAIIEMLKPAA